MKRRQFLAHAAGAAAILTLVPSVLGACDGDSTDTDVDDDTNGDTEGDTEADTDDVGTDTDPGTEVGDDDCIDCAASVAEGESDFHGHFICLTQAELDGGSDITHTSTGGAHDHTFTITAAQLADIAAGNVVTISSNDTHAHTWDVSMC